MLSPLGGNHKKLRVVPRQSAVDAVPHRHPTLNSAKPANQTSRSHLLPQRSLACSQTRVLSWPCSQDFHGIGVPKDWKGGQSYPRVLRAAVRRCDAHSAPDRSLPHRITWRLHTKSNPPNQGAITRAHVQDPKFIPAVRVLGTSQWQKSSSARQGRGHPSPSLSALPRRFPCIPSLSRSPAIRRNLGPTRRLSELPLHIILPQAPL